MRGQKQKTKALVCAPALSLRARAEGTTLGRREAPVWGGGGVPSPPGRGRNSALLLPLPQVDADKVAPALLLTHPQERQPPAQGKSTRHPLPPCQPPPRAGSAPPGCSAPTNPPATPAHRAGLGPTGSPVPLMGGPVAKAGRGQLPYLSMSPPSLSLK